MIELLRYRLDNLFARGTKALLAVLALFLVVLIGFLAVLMMVLQVGPGPDAGPMEKVWTLFVYTFDPTGVPYNDGVWSYRIIMLCASIGGVFILSLLVGILANGFADAIHTLRKGKSIVVEHNHTLVLGWGDQIFSVLHELITANANVRNACVVILADVDKVEMEDAVRSRVARVGSTRIVCRSGSPYDVETLSIVKPQDAKSIIVLDTPTEDADHSDALTIKTLLALTLLRGDVCRGSIVATVRNVENVHVAQLIAGDNASIIPSNVIVSQIITQTCRQPGLSLAYSELLDFDGDELYFKEEAALVGKTFAEALLCYESSCIVGLRFADGTTKLNPPMDTQISRGDAIIALSADDDTVVLRKPSSKAAILTQHVIQRIATPTPAEFILVLGWNARGSIILPELDHYVGEGSRILIVDEHDHSRDIADMQQSLSRLSITSLQGLTTSRDVLNALNVETFTSIIVLADTTRDIQQADARTLMTLIHLRDLTSQIADSSALRINIVTEMLDERNRSLAAQDGSNDFIISNTIISLLLTQIAENRDLHGVFTDLFDAHGSELYLKPARDYVLLDTPVSFDTVVYSASQQGEVAIGFKVKVDGHWVVKLNVCKSHTYTFSKDDNIVVIAKD